MTKVSKEDRKKELKEDEIGRLRKDMAQRNGIGRVLKCGNI